MEASQNGGYLQIIQVMNEHFRLFYIDHFSAIRPWVSTETHGDLGIPQFQNGHGFCLELPLIYLPMGIE